MFEKKLKLFCARVHYRQEIEESSELGISDNFLANFVCLNHKPTGASNFCPGKVTQEIFRETHFGFQLHPPASRSLYYLNKRGVQRISEKCLSLPQEERYILQQ